MPTDNDALLGQYLREPRRVRRAVSRVLARRHINGPRPQYQPATAPECAQHHRKLPCKRCP